MPMSPRLLRPIASRSLVDADAAAYLTAVESADGQALEPAVRNAITAFVIGCKADGIWSAIQASCILAGARTLAGALVPLKGAAPTPFNFAAGDYNRETGLVGDGTSKYLNSNRANNADPQNDNHNAVFITTVGTSVAMGAGGSLNGANTIGAAASRNRSLSASSYGTTLVAPTMVGITRSDSTVYTQRFNGGNQAAAIASQAPVATNVMVFQDGANVAIGNHRLAFYSIGESLDLEALDTRVSALITAIGAAI